MTAARSSVHDTRWLREFGRVLWTIGRLTGATPEREEPARRAGRRRRPDCGDGDRRLSRAAIPERRSPAIGRRPGGTDGGLHAVVRRTRRRPGTGDTKDRARAMNRPVSSSRRSRLSSGSGSPARKRIRRKSDSRGDSDPARRRGSASRRSATPGRESRRTASSRSPRSASCRVRMASPTATSSSTPTCTASWAQVSAGEGTGRPWRRVRSSDGMSSRCPITPRVLGSRAGGRAETCSCAGWDGGRGSSHKHAAVSWLKKCAEERRGS